MLKESDKTLRVGNTYIIHSHKIAMEDIGDMLSKKCFNIINVLSYKCGNIFYMHMFV